MEQDYDQAALIDLRSLDMSELLALDEPALHRSVDRVLKEINDPDGVISAFQSFAA
jgi:FXSXX-COOH protein